MKKFYYLNPDKQWKGPYWYLQILSFALIGKIKPSTYLWHDKLTEDIGNHPLASIYARKRADEFRMLPLWVFGHNIAIAVGNARQRLKSLRSEERSWQSFIQKPIETPEILKNAVKINLVPSIVAIHDFAAPGDYKVKLVYLDINTNEPATGEYSITLRPDKKPGIRFEITMTEPPNVGGVEYKESYGLHSQLGLIGENDLLMVARDSVFDFHTRFPFKPQILTGRFKQVNLICAHEYKNVFNRLIIKMEDDKMIGPLDILEHTGWAEYDHDKFNVHPSLMGPSFKTGGGYTEVKIDSSVYRLYNVEGDLLLIDGLDREDLEIFKQKAEAIRIALALLSGKFYGGACNYVTSDDGSFTAINGIWYELEKESVLSPRRVIDLQLYRQSFQSGGPAHKATDRPVISGVFSKLCGDLYSNDELFHAAKLIISGMGNPDPLQQGALYSVALETLTNVLSLSKSAGLKPIQDKKVFDKLAGELERLLDTYNGIIPKDGLDILRKKMKDINNPTNRDKLVKTFSSYGITLTQLDEETIGKRNSYLHGRSPLAQKQTFELTQISLRLHTLISALLLKSAGYSGHIINVDVNAYLADDGKLNDLLDRTNQLAQQIENAIKQQDAEGLQTAHAGLQQEIDNFKLKDLIRII